MEDTGKYEKVIVNNKMKRDDFEKLREIFFSKLERKTGWGKEEVKKLWLEAVVEFLMNENSNKS